MKALFWLAIPLTLAANCIPTPPADVSTFELEIEPEIVQPLIPGQHCVLLVHVVNETSGTGQGEAVALTATVSGATATVEPSSLTPGQVSEVTVIPEEASVGQELTVTVTGQRSGEQATATKTLTVEEGDITEFSSLEPTAEEMRDLFIPWLETNHPALGITSETEWTGLVVSPYILVVSHYLFFSDEWEMHVYWHVMIPPYDWAKIDLRHRFTETTYSYSFEISSRSDPAEEPHAIELPEDLWR
ncbi:MAG: hypothetical protein GX616_10380 [Planctomycetes bacterium]|nr:hypothetical protein [Planctomycetota bacterium]